MAFFHQSEIDVDLQQMVLRTSKPSAKIESGNWERNMSDASNSAHRDRDWETINIIDMLCLMDAVNPKG